MPGIKLCYKKRHVFQRFSNNRYKNIGILKPNHQQCYIQKIIYTIHPSSTCHQQPCCVSHQFFSCANCFSTLSYFTMNFLHVSWEPKGTSAAAVPPPPRNKAPRGRRRAPQPTTNKAGCFLGRTVALGGGTLPLDFHEKTQVFSHPLGIR